MLTWDIPLSKTVILTSEGVRWATECTTGTAGGANAMDAVASERAIRCGDLAGDAVASNLFRADRHFNSLIRVSDVSTVVSRYKL